MKAKSHGTSVLLNAAVIATQTKVSTGISNTTERCRTTDQSGVANTPSIL